MTPPLSEVNKTIRINGLTFEEYCNNPELVRKDAESAGVKGEEYTHYHTTKGCYNGKTTKRFKPLHNGHLYDFAKTRYANNGSN